MFKGFCPGDTHLEFSRNFCEMGPSSKDVFDHIVVHAKGRVLTLKKKSG